MPSQSPTFCNSRTLVKTLGYVTCLSILTFGLPAQADNKSSRYIIKEGDTLSSIAEQMGIGYSKLAEIAAANNINNENLIFPGQVIDFGDFIIPDTEPDAEPSQAEQPEQTPDAKPAFEESEPEQIETQTTLEPEEAQIENTQTENTDDETEQKVEDASDKEVTVEPDKQTVVETETANIETSKKADKPLWRYKPSFTAGFSLGQSFLDIETNNFEVSNQSINLDIDDSSPNLALFIIMSLNKDAGIELGLHHLGIFEFTGVIGEPVQLGTSQGEQKIQAISLSAYYTKRFQHFDARVNAGIMQTRHETSGEIDLVGSAAESIDYSENSSNPFISLEANRRIYETWSLGPRLSWIDAGDPVQSIAIRLFRPIE